MIFFFKIYTLEKIRNSQKSSENFFEGIVMDLFKFYTKKCSKLISRKLQRNFQECIQDDSSKNLYSGKVSNDIKKKFQFFGIKESLKIAFKTCFFKKILNKKLHGHENHKSFDLFINGGTY